MHQIVDGENRLFANLVAQSVLSWKYPEIAIEGRELTRDWIDKGDGARKISSQSNGHERRSRL
jgi:hypothetical protein